MVVHECDILLHFILFLFLFAFFDILGEAPRFWGGKGGKSVRRIWAFQIFAGLGFVRVWESLSL